MFSASCLTSERFLKCTESSGISAAHRNMPKSHILRQPDRHDMNKYHLQSLIQNITVWKQGAQRAPHKPLLLLYTLARSQQNQERFIPYLEIDEKLKQLLMDFGPSRKSYNPEYPFWRLQNDDIWELKNVRNVRINRSGRIFTQSLDSYNGM